MMSLRRKCEAMPQFGTGKDITLSASIPFSASDGEKVAGGRMRCLRESGERAGVRCRNSVGFNGPIMVEGVTRLAKRLPVEQRQMVGEVLVCVAGADGIISSSEWAALDRACKTLDLPPSALEDILRRLGATFEEPTVQEAEPGEPGELLPARGTAPSAPKSPAFKLDMTRVAAISNETAQIIGLLSTVMREEEAKPPAWAAPATATATTIPPQQAPRTKTPVWLATLWY